MVVAGGVGGFGVFGLEEDGEGEKAEGEQEEGANEDDDDALSSIASSGGSEFQDDGE